MWSHHQTFGLCLFSQRIVILHGLKYFKWPDTFFLIARGSHEHHIIITFSSSKYKNFSIIRKIIYSHKLLTKNLGLIMTSLGVTGCQNVLNWVVKIVKLKLYGFTQETFTAFLEFLSSKLFFRVSKSISPLNIFQL